MGERELSLDVLARHGAQHMLDVALEEEVTATIRRCAHLKELTQKLVGREISICRDRSVLVIPQLKPASSLR